jgi:hypothetical protein
MFDIVLKRTFEEFSDNFKVALSFGVLFVFVAFFVFFEQFFISSGTVFLFFDINLLAIVGLLGVLVFFYAFSFFISLAVYSIQRDIHRLTLDDYWNVLLKKGALNIFIFYFSLVLLFFVLSTLGLTFSQIVFSSVIMFVISTLLMYVPQSIIFDEVGIGSAIRESVSFWRKNFGVSFGILFLSTIALFIIMIIEFVIDYFGFPGSIISFGLVLIFLIPFVEQMKSYAYILKNDLIRAPEISSAKHKKKFVDPFERTTRLRERNPKGKL